MSDARGPSGRRSMRLQGFDYASPGAYFVTICTRNRKLHFGDERLLDIAQTCWVEIPSHFSFVELDAWVVMPNHVHGILITSPRRGVQLNAPTKRGNSPRPKMTESAKHFSKISPQRGSLGVIVRTYKAAVTRKARESGFSGFGWQRGYYDRIIRNEVELKALREYIVQNPLKWTLDMYYLEEG